MIFKLCQLLGRAMFRQHIVALTILLMELEFILHLRPFEKELRVDLRRPCLIPGGQGQIRPLLNLMLCSGRRRVKE